MKRISLGFAAGILLFSTPALAGHCPKDISAIDAALSANTSISATERAEIQSMRDKGEALHKEGKHAESLAALHPALEKLGLNH